MATLEFASLPIAILLLVVGSTANPSSSSPGSMQCVMQRLPVKNRMDCDCLPEGIGLGNANLMDPAPAPVPAVAPAPAPAPARRNPVDDHPNRRVAPARSPAIHKVSRLSVQKKKKKQQQECLIQPWNPTSWCQCKDHKDRDHAVSKSGNSLAAAATIIVAIPSELNVDRIIALLPFGTLATCARCACPNLAVLLLSPSPAPSPQVAAPSESTSLCLCTNCSALISPAPSPEPSPADESLANPSLGADDVGPNLGIGNQGIVMKSKPPPPRVVITNHRVKHKLLAFLLPLLGFSICVLVFLAVVFGGRHLLCCSSSGSSFSHLHSET